MKKNKILIVEDTKILVNVLKKILTNFGFEHIEEAYTYENALEKIENFSPDIITLDIDIPSENLKNNGMTLLHKLRKEKPETDVVMISGKASAENVRTSLVSGAKAFILKPFQRKQLEDTLKKIVSEKYKKKVAKIKIRKEKNIEKYPGCDFLIETTYHNNVANSIDITLKHENGAVITRSIANIENLDKDKNILMNQLRINFERMYKIKLDM